MRINVKKFVFVGVKKDRNLFFARAQKMGHFQFIHKSDRDYVVPEDVVQMRRVLKILKPHSLEKQVLLHPSEMPKVISQICTLHDTIEKLSDEAAGLRSELIKIEPLGMFDIREVKELSQKTGLCFQFFFMKHDKIKQEELPSELIYISHWYDFNYYLYIGEKPFVHPYFTEIMVKQPLAAVKKELFAVAADLKKHEQELRGMTRFFSSIERYLVSRLNAVNLEFAYGDVDVWLKGEIFSIEAYVPKNKVKYLRNLCVDLGIDYAEVATSKSETLPTYLENKGAAKIGEDLVKIYDTPSVEDKDPSLWVLCAFALFFGMIISDAAYGFIFLAASLFFYFKVRRGKPVLRRISKLALLLSSSTILWGILIATYFSIQISPENPISKPSILLYLVEKKLDFQIRHKDEMYEFWIKEFPHLKETNSPVDFIKKGKVINGDEARFVIMEETSDSILMEISLVVGILHLILSFCRNIYRNLASVAWIFVIIGGFLFFPKIVEANIFVEYVFGMRAPLMYLWGQWLLYGGLIGMFAISIVQSGFAGLLAVFKVIEVFADTLSYLRLYALGLASIVLASTCNEIAHMVGGGVQGAVVLLVGHSINISLGTMAGVIHGLRLNFLEWYHHSFEGGGKLFNPLRLLTY
ncbi:MAG: hypothetical protein A3F09_03125 [Chlamydiae bacterium RIFCSPHIGHO2_12_FULL_49_11]|nr:MAG: hypothetical protein A3F09_03125 [Chlamydiae bacterium RIFCSPHIGHO2_12_FULL_49_11]